MNIYCAEKSAAIGLIKRAGAVHRICIAAIMLVCIPPPRRPPKYEHTAEIYRQKALLPC